MKISQKEKPLYDKDSEIACPLNESAINEMYEEMQLIIHSLCRNPRVIQIPEAMEEGDYICHDCIEEIGANVVKLAHSILISSKTYQLAMLEELEKRNGIEAVTVDDHFINDAAEKCAGI